MLCLIVKNRRGHEQKGKTLNPQILKLCIIKYEGLEASVALSGFARMDRKNLGKTIDFEAFANLLDRARQLRQKMAGSH